jgi:hypothetical protein
VRVRGADAIGCTHRSDMMHVCVHCHCAATRKLGVGGPAYIAYGEARARAPRSTLLHLREACGHRVPWACRDAIGCTFHSDMMPVSVARRRLGGVGGRRGDARRHGMRMRVRVADVHTSAADAGENPVAC